MTGMAGENIVAFAKDWSENPTSCNHVLGGLAHDNQVLWLNSIASRVPSLSSARDLRTIGRKLSRFASGPQPVSRGMTVLTPIVLPFPHSPLASRINGTILRRTIAGQRARLGMSDFQAWAFLPTAVDHIGTLGESLSVYYCTDQWAEFSSLEGEKIRSQEKELVRKVDVVFATARSIVEQKRQLNPETHLISHGVDRDHFARALSAETPVPADIAHLPRPIIGFFGLIEDWIDTDLFVFLARKRPAWSIVVIGQSHIGLDGLLGIPNLHLIGRRPYRDLPAYSRAFAVGLCPFRLNELTAHVNPIKLREYLSAGLPVVSSDLPECRLPVGLGRVARSHEEFLAEIEAAIATDSDAARHERSEAMKTETWQHKLREIGAHVLRVKQSKARARRKA
jgi:glycosyltransferase involved in cell wall biosynthesis